MSDQRGLGYDSLLLLLLLLPMRATRGTTCFGQQNVFLVGARLLNEVTTQPPGRPGGVSGYPRAWYRLVS